MGGFPSNPGCCGCPRRFSCKPGCCRGCPHLLQPTAPDLRRPASLEFSPFLPRDPMPPVEPTAVAPPTLLPPPQPQQPQIQPLPVVPIEPESAVPTISLEPQEIVGPDEDEAVEVAATEPMEPIAMFVQTIGPGAADGEFSNPEPLQPRPESKKAELRGARPEYQRFMSQNTQNGILKVQAFLGRQSYPAPGLLVTVTKYLDGEEVVFFEGMTDENGIIDPIFLPAPPKAYSFDPLNADVDAEYLLRAQKEGYTPFVMPIQVFEGVKTIQPIQLQVKAG